MLRSLVLTLLILLAWPAATSAQEMSFKAVDLGDCRTSCARVLLGEGEIGVNTDRVFRAALRRHGPDLPVILHSPGGNLKGGLMLGVAFRDARRPVAVAPGGMCYSACAYALLGGVERRVPTNGKLGVHDFFKIDERPGRRVSRAEKQERADIAELLRAYARAMGVDPRIISLAAATKSSGMKVLSRAELRRMRVVTSG
jgi:hypothetical protein